MRVALAIGLLCVSSAASAQHYGRPAQPYYVVQQTPSDRTDLGGGFIEYLFGERGPRPITAPSPQPQYDQRPIYQTSAPPQATLDPQSYYQTDPRYLPQDVDYAGDEPVGTIVVDTPSKYLFLVTAPGKARRYGIGVGRPGFTWSGSHSVTAKKEWPDWRPPDEMLVRQPWLPQFMAGGPNNPLGARALYLGSTLYRIHGSNEPWTIGQNVSSGCIRMRNEDVIDLYDRVKVGARVVVI